MNKIIYLIFIFSVSLTYGQGPIVIAHRGGAYMAPENTLAAFHKAIEVNADYFELDVMISNDDSLMLMHDGTIDRTTDGTGSVATMSYNELRALDAGSWFGPEFAGEKIPTLSEALEAALASANNIGVIIELKSTDFSVPELVVNMVQKYGMQNRVVISSFSLTQITEVKKFDSSIPVQIFASVTNAVIDQVKAIGGEWVGSSSANQTLIDYAHSQGILFNIWTINSAASMISYTALGVDAITTDDPALLIALNDVTPPSDVVLTSATPNESLITLRWEAAEDLESGIAGYDIYRGLSTEPSDLLVSVGNVTEFQDQTYTENQPYFYRLKAKNLAGLTSLNYSNELTVTTGPDITAPVFFFVSSNSANNIVVVEFTERIDQLTAENPANFSINDGIAINSANLALDQKSVILTTSPMEDKFYTLTVNNIKDQASEPNTMVPDTAIFFHKNPVPETVALYRLDDWIESGDITIVDESNNHNNGIVMGGAFLSEGYIGNALGFDGVDDYVQFSTSPSFDINSQTVTVSVWTKLDYLPSEMTSSFGPLFDSDADQYVLYADRGNRELRFKVSSSVSAERPGIPEAALTKGEWIHVVGVYNGQQAMVYLNGLLKDSHNLTGTVKTGQVAMLGKSGTAGTPSFFSGSIDNVEVYNLALSGEEVMALFKSYKQENQPVCAESELVEDVSVCGGETYTFPDGSTSSVSMVNISNGMTGQGCYSIITTNLTVKAIDNTVTQNGIVLTANQSGASYKWLDCNNNNAEISGATDISFSPESNGNYCVEITYDGCVDTSDCINVTSIGINETNSADFLIYPNPSTGKFSIELKTIDQYPYTIEIFNSLGQLVTTRKSEIQEKSVVINQFDSGVYIVKITQNRKSQLKQLIVY
ncbi:MAG: T9SS type A sorting domain-containing protein [Bacteroidales bacterium]|nr:T9SS type A sorting domain-containing protein [Bacteroidales bacterium]MCF8390031.1 T9SS type A sorting domain-containing protein [Bacteroidales bacterium]